MGQKGERALTSGTITGGGGSWECQSLEPPDYMGPGSTQLIISYFRI